MRLKEYILPNQTISLAAENGFSAGFTNKIIKSSIQIQITDLRTSRTLFSNE